jgi:hypothetical protein
MSVFTPPTINDRPSYNEDSTPEQRALFKFFGHSLNPRYVMVYQLSDGSFVQDTPTTGHTNTVIPLPWDPNDPAGPYATAVYIDYSTTPPSLKVDRTSHSVYIVATYNAPTVVSSAVATLLTAAGYTVT